MNRDFWRDRFMDMLLRERLAEERPPQLGPRILRALPPPRVRRVFWWPLAAAAAAALLAAPWLLRWWGSGPQPPVEVIAYPAPQMNGGVNVAGNGPAVRAARLHTEADAGEVVLGGYARVQMQPGTTLQLQGREQAEKVWLEKGEILCRVISGRGRSFAVQTEAGTASVLGTEFSVQIRENAMKVKEMVVKVLTGAVLVTAAHAGQATVRAEDEAAAVVVTPDHIQMGVRQAVTNETPEMKEVRALQIQLEFLRDEQRAIRNAAMKSPEVAAAIDAHKAAVGAFTEKLDANPEYKALLAEKEKLGEQVLTLQREAGNLKDPQVRQKYYAELGPTYRKVHEVNQKIVAFPDAMPELAALKRAKQDAAVAFLKVLEGKLGADTEYTRLEGRIKEIQELTNQAQQGRVNRWGNPGGDRRFEGQGDGHRPRGGQNEQAPAEPHKDEQVF